MSEKKLLLIDLIDLDELSPEGFAEVYEAAERTVKYLNDFKKSIDKRVLDGETLPFFEIVKGRGSRVVTASGKLYLANVYGDKAFVKMPIGINALEELVGKEEMENLLSLGVIDIKYSADKVVVKK